MKHAELIKRLAYTGCAYYQLEAKTYMAKAHRVTLRFTESHFPPPAWQSIIQPVMGQQARGVLVEIDSGGKPMLREVLAGQPPLTSDPEPGRIYLTILRDASGEVVELVSGQEG
jgi:hypothetical protein